MKARKNKIIYINKEQKKENKLEIKIIKLSNLPLVEHHRYPLDHEED